MTRQSKQSAVAVEAEAVQAQVLTTTLPEEAERRLGRTLAEEQ